MGDIGRSVLLCVRLGGIEESILAPRGATRDGVRKREGKSERQSRRERRKALKIK